jgi:hypothetical protein
MHMCLRVLEVVEHQQPQLVHIHGRQIKYSMLQICLRLHGIFIS